jgi:CheY-like chemotaxis protein
MTSRRGPVLVVDDDDDLRSLVAEVLEDEGYDVATAPNGAEALAALRSGAPRPGVVLLDLVMPGVDGHEVLDAIDADASLRGLTVLLLTGDAGDAARRVTGVVTKPIDVDGLLAAVARAAGPA